MLTRASDTREKGRAGSGLSQVPVRGMGCLARNIRYATIMPITKYCPIFILSLAGVQQDSGLARNYSAPICQKTI